ncbi:MarP family serine protease [Kocuria sp.]|uniref:MarP family serine protease n=1 Tax=Kocuria sp. TaxID=1871328 RepID=UPI0026DACA62|nr:MarP family serine protease [Kocuria sp.]MDO4918287.1 MarP family serine protease [Kocuria sp.]
MTLALNLLDVLLILALLAYLVAGFHRGFFRSFAGLLGLVLGAVLAFWAGPVVAAYVSDDWRVPTVLLTVLLALALGEFLGSRLGGVLSRALERTGAGMLDRLGGAVLNVVVAALIMSLLGSLVGQMGIPSLSQQVASSQVLRGIERLTPDPVRHAMTETRNAVSGAQGIRQLDELLFPSQAAPDPQQTPDSQTVADAGQSVVQVYGTAAQCAQNQTGSGFVAQPGTVVTNAHVVAGVDQPVVQTRDGRVYSAQTVHYDAASDLAVLRVPGLSEAALPLRSSVTPGETVSFAGYPLGGPYTLRPATVQGEAVAPVQNVTTGETQTRSIIQIAGNVEQGNSGGPLLDDSGRVLGVVFAKAVQGEAGYVIPADRVQEALTATGEATAAASTGQCVAS